MTIKSIISIACGILLLATQASATFITKEYRTVGSPTISGGSFNGGDVETLRVHCYVPNGAANGTYYFNQGFGQNIAIITVSGGVSSRPAPTVGATSPDLSVHAGGYSDEVVRTANIYCNGPGHTTENGGLGILLYTYSLQKQYTQRASGDGVTRFIYTDKTFTNSGDVSPQMPHEPWTINVTKQGWKTYVWQITGPSGSVEADGTISGAPGASTITFTPVTAAPGGLGTYTLRVGEVPNASSDPLNIVGSKSNTLVLGNTNTAYSTDWTENPSSLGVGSNTGEPGDGEVTNNTGSPITTTWKDASGNTVGAGPTIAAGGSIKTDGSGQGLPVPASGGSATYKLTDAAGNTLTTVTVSNVPGDPPFGGVHYSASGGATINPPATNPTPTATQTNTGNTQTGVTATGPGGVTSPGANGANGADGQNGGTLVNNGGTTISGTSTGATVQDLYNANKTAMDDVGKTGYTGAASSGVTSSALTLTRGKLDDVQGELDNAKAKMNTIRGSMPSKISSLSLAGMSSSFGTVSSISVATLPVINTTISLDLVNGVMGPKVSLIRTAFLFGLTIGWIVLTARTIRGYL